MTPALPSLSCLPFLRSVVFAVAISLGEYHSCVIVAGGGIKCWGFNERGQLGIGSTGNRYSPVDVPGETLEL